MEKLFITGINGLIGSVLVEGLQDTFAIWGLDRSAPFSDCVLEADIRDIQQISRAFQAAGKTELLIHLAAVSSADAPWESVLEDNIVGTRNVFEAARQFNIRRVVFASSNHVTGAYEGFKPDLHLYKEYEPEQVTTTHPVRPDGYYGVSKVFGEALARFFAARWGMEFICLRIGTVLKDDDPTKAPRHRKTWLSHRDLIHLVERCLVSKVAFGIYYGVSDNRGAFWDIGNARSELGYNPMDDASTR